MKTNVFGIMRDLEEEERRYKRRRDALKDSLAYARQNEIARIRARFEFESDEFMTADEKAEIYLKTGKISARW